MGPVPSRPGLLAGILWEFLVGKAVSSQRGGNRKRQMITLAICAWVRACELPPFPCWPRTEASASHVSVCRKGWPAPQSWADFSLLSLSTSAYTEGWVSVLGLRSRWWTSDFFFFPLMNNVKWGWLPFSLLIWFGGADVQLCLRVCGWLCVYFRGLSRCKGVDTSLLNYVIWEWASGSFPKWGASSPSSVVAEKVRHMQGAVGSSTSLPKIRLPESEVQTEESRAKGWRGCLRVLKSSFELIDQKLEALVFFIFWANIFLVLPKPLWMKFLSRKIHTILTNTCNKHLHAILGNLEITISILQMRKCRFEGPSNLHGCYR